MKNIPWYKIDETNNRNKNWIRYANHDQLIFFHAWFYYLKCILLYWISIYGFSLQNTYAFHSLLLKDKEKRCKQLIST